jgi:transposase
MGILPEFQGTAVHDFWAPYFGYACSHATCNAHLLRELRGITENFGHHWSGALGNLLSEIKAAVDAAKGEGRVLTPEKIAAFEEQYLRVLEAGKEELEASDLHEVPGKRGRKKQSKAKNLLDRCYKYQKEILAFMKDPIIPFTNNQAERDLRMMKLKQKISGTFRSEKGARNFCRIRGFISMIKKHGRQVLPELMRVFEGAPFIPTAVHRVS